MTPAVTQAHDLAIDQLKAALEARGDAAAADEERRRAEEEARREAEARRAAEAAARAAAEAARVAAEYERERGCTRASLGAEFASLEAAVERAGAGGAAAEAAAAEAAAAAAAAEEELLRQKAAFKATLAAQLSVLLPELQAEEWRAAAARETARRAATRAAVEYTVLGGEMMRVEEAAQGSAARAAAAEARARELEALGAANASAGGELEAQRRALQEKLAAMEAAAAEVAAAAAAAAAAAEAERLRLEGLLRAEQLLLAEARERAVAQEAAWALERAELQRLAAEAAKRTSAYDNPVEEATKQSSLALLRALVTDDRLVTKDARRLSSAAGSAGSLPGPRRADSTMALATIASRRSSTVRRSTRPRPVRAHAARTLTQRYACTHARTRTHARTYFARAHLVPLASASFTTARQREWVEHSTPECGEHSARTAGIPRGGRGGRHLLPACRPFPRVPSRTRAWSAPRS